MFIFMWILVYHSGLIKPKYSGISKWVGIIPGGLVHANIVGCALFAACSGSSLACAATMGSVAYPDQVTERGYNKRLVLGSLAGGGTIGILIPPSITMIVYGAFVGESVGQLFMAGVIPGLILTVMFMLYVLVMSLKDPSLTPMKRQKVNLGYFLGAILAIKEVWPALVLIVFILGSIYGGFCTPTEAGAISVFIVLVMTAAFRLLTWGVLKKAVLEAMTMNGFICLLIIGANILGKTVGQLKIPVMMAETVAAVGLSPMMVWAIAALLYIIAGCFIDALGLIIITLPIIYPLMMSLGFDGIWLGVMLVMMNECGLITPPFGMNLFVLQGITKQKDIREVALGSLPFFGIIVAAVIIFSAFPELVLWLPSQMFSGW